MTSRTRQLIAMGLVLTLVFAPSASATPVFDCTKVEVRRAHPAQCPELGVPFLLGGGHSGGGGPCGVACRVGRFLHDVTGGLL